MRENSGVRVLPVIAATTVVVVGIYDVVLLGPATVWLEGQLVPDFGSALPAGTQFIVDTHWVLLAGVVLTHGGAAWWARRRFGLAACVAAMVLSAALTGFWAWAAQLPFFSLAGAIK